ncbi:lipoprotein 17-related variable surface protein [Mycoplasmopsis glycophila]|uniref:ECM-binding protein homolog n=2 Tax=Mycoplasmopsis glycophila TaxID=171285 RepID=A0A449AVG2_9BACT|nr:lipoprotein 17-related variable surface protein [Mycoplasmopsis glycophila]VEU70502.1 Uncharacterised protein [Mycoplasmopsis glycophila]
MNKKNIFKLLGATLSSTVFLITSSGLVPIYMGKDTTDTKYDSFFYEDTDIYSHSRYSPYGSWDGSSDYRFEGYNGTQNFVTVGDTTITNNRDPRFLDTNYIDRFSKESNWVDPKSLDGKKRKWKLIYHKQQPASFRDNRYLGGFYFSEDMILADNSVIKFSFYPADINEIDYANVSTREIPVSWTNLPTNKDYTFINPLYSQNPYFEDRWQNIVNWVNPENTSTAGAAGYNNNSEIRLRGLWSNSAYPWTAEELAVAEKNGLTRDNRSVIANRLINDPVTSLGRGNPGFYHKSTKKINNFDNGKVAARLKQDGLYDEELLKNDGDGFWNLLNQNAGYMFTFFIDAPNARNKGWLNNVVVVEFETVENPNFQWNGKNSVPTFLGGAYTLFDVGFNSGFEGESGFIIRSKRAKSTQYKFRIKERVESSDSNFYLPKSFKRREDNEIDNKLYEVGVYYTNQSGTEIKLFDLDRNQYNKINNAREYYSEYNLNSVLDNINPNSLKIKATIKDPNFRNQWQIAEAQLSSTNKDPQGFYVFNDLVYTPLVTDRLKIEQMLQTEFPNLSGWVSDLVQKFISNEFKSRGENKSESDVWFNDHENASIPDDKKYVNTFMKLLRRMIPMIQFAAEVDETYYSDTNKELSSDENKLISQLNFAYSSTQNLKDMIVKLHEFLSNGKNALKNNQPLPEGQKAATEWGFKLTDILGIDHQTYDQEVAKLDGYKVIDNTASGNIYNIATSEFKNTYSELYETLSEDEKNNLYKLFKDKAIQIINNQFTSTASNGGIDNLIETDSTQNLNKLREFQATVADAIQKRKYLNNYIDWIKKNLKTSAGEWKETASKNTLSTRQGEEGQEEYNKFIDAFDNAEYQQIFLNDPTKEFLSNYDKFNKFKTKLESGLTTLTEALKTLDGNKNQAKKAVNSFVFVESNETERQGFDTFVNELPSNYEVNNGVITNTNWTSNNEKLANQINTLFAKAKSNLTTKLNQLTDLTEQERNKYIQLVTDAQINPISEEFSKFGNDANLKLIHDKAVLTNHIRSLTNLTDKQKQALIDQINITDTNDSNYLSPENYETFKTNATNLDKQMKALKEYYDGLPNSLKPNENREITDELYVYERTKSEKDNYKNLIEKTKTVIDDSAKTPITNSKEIETLLSDLEKAKSKLDGSSSYLPRQNELQHMTVELKQQLLKEIDKTITDDSEKEKRFTFIKALDQAIGLELKKIKEWQTNYVVDTNVGYKNAIDSLKTAADNLTTELIAGFNLKLADGNENKDKFNQVEQEDPNNYSGLFDKAFANFKALKAKLETLKSKLDESTRLYNLTINHTNKKPELFATNVAKNYTNDKTPFTVAIIGDQPEAVIKNIEIVSANDVEGKLEITYEIVSTKTKLTDVKTKVQTYVFKAETNDNYQTEKQRLNTIANSINKDQSKINHSFTVANELANSETAKNKDNYSYPSATSEKLTFDITSINPEADYERSTLNFTLTSTKSKGDLFWRSDNNLENITYTAPQSDANSVMITGFKNVEKDRLDGLSGYLIDRIKKSEILASKVNLDDLNTDKWTWSPEVDGEYTFADKRIVSYDDITGEIELGFKLESTKDNLQVIKSDEKIVTISGFRTKAEQDKIDREAEKKRLNNLNVTLDYKNKTTTLPSEAVIEKVTAAIKETDPEARVVIDSIDARHEIDGYIGIKYHLVSEKSDEIYKNVTSDNKYVQIKGFKTEQMRLDEIIKNLEIEAGIKNVASDQYNKWTASKSLKDLILNKLASNQDASYNLKVVDKSANDNTGEISYTWQIVSNRGVVNSQNLNTVTSSSKHNKSGTLNGFKNLAQIEKERLDALDFTDKVENGVLYNIDYPNKANEQASSLTDATTNWTWDTFNKDNYKFINQQIIGYNDLTGEIHLSFQIKSTKPEFSSVVSNTKEIILSGFETELQRLNKLVDTNPYNISLNSTVNTKNQKASTLNKDSFSASVKENGDSTSNHISDLLLTDANDNTGQVGVKYKLISNRQVNTDQNDLKKLVSNWKETFNEQKVISKESNPVNFEGFLTNTKEEEIRIEGLLPQIVLDFENRNKYLPLYNQSDVIASKVIVKLNNNETLEQNHMKIKENSLTIIDTERDDREGYIKVTYTLQSTKEGLENAEIVVNETRSANTNKLSGFKTELQRLTDLAFDFANSISDKNQKQASDTTIAISNLSQNDAKTANITINNKTRDDRNGTLSGTYSVYSTREGLNDIHVDDKAFTIDGFLTEQARIDALLTNDAIQAHVEYKLDNQAEILPSELLANKEDVLNNLSTYFETNLDNEAINQANLKIIDLTANDIDGSISFKYKIASTKENLTDIESASSETITLSGFLNQLDKYKKEAKKIVDALDNLSENEKAQFKDNIDKSATKEEVDNIIDKAKITDLINQIDKTYPYLNPKQKADLKDSLINESDYNQVLKNFEKYSSINDKMKKLNDLINHYDQLIADQSNVKYHRADDKTEFDRILNKAKELSQSTTDNGLDNNQFNLDNLIDNHTNKDSLDGAYQRLNGKEVDLIEKIKANDYLTNNEKTQLIAQVNKVAENNKTNNIEQEQKALDKIQNQMDDIQKQKQALIDYVNQDVINNQSNLINQSQKDHLINQIKNSDLNEAKTNKDIADQLNNLLNQIKELTDKYPDVVNSYKYQRADQDKKDAYDKAIDNGKKLINNETPNGYNSPNTSVAETQEILDKIKQTFKAIDDEAKKINDLYEKLNAKIIEYQKDVDNKELPKEIQDILDELVNYGEDINGINKLIELIEQGKLLKSLHEQWNNSDVKNPDTEKAIQDLNAKINSITELINLVKSSNLNSKLDTSKDFVLNHNQYNLNFAEAEISYFDALKNIDKTKFIEATNKLEQLNQTKFVEFANSILNTSYFDTYKPESNLNKKLIKELLKLNYDPLNTIEKSLFETLLKEKAGVEEKLSWLWYLALGLSTTLAAIMIGVLVKKSKK